MEEIESLEILLDKIITDVKDKHAHPILENFKINFKIELPVVKSEVDNQLAPFVDSNKFLFKNCHFLKKVKFVENDINLRFEECDFYNIECKDITFKNKVRFHNCKFKRALKLNNITFEDLVDFWSSEFYRLVIFYKVDFEKTTVFSSVIFKDNVLFTFSKLSDQVIFKGTVFERGLDLATAIIVGKLNLFNVKLGDYVCEHISSRTNNDPNIKWKNSYDGYITDQGIIPTINKRETFRILKEEFERLKNIPESLRYKVLEHRTYRNLLGLKDKNIHEKFDWLNLWLNDFSSFYGTSYLRAFIFTITLGGFLFYLSIMSTGIYDFNLNPSKWKFTEGLKYFVQFLIPTHKFDYLGENLVLETRFYLFDFLGRLVVGYGIYQFIQAFRKYK